MRSLVPIIIRNIFGISEIYQRYAKINQTAFSHHITGACGAASSQYSSQHSPWHITAAVTCSCRLTGPQKLTELTTATDQTTRLDITIREAQLLDVAVVANSHNLHRTTSSTPHNL
jgi:hypothetical protein